MESFDKVTQNQNEFKLKKNKSNRLQWYTLAIISSLIIYTAFISIQDQQNHQKIYGSINDILPIYSGEMHFSRVPQQYWEHRILMIKSMGMNAISVYIMWNYHETSKGQFDFESKNKNITAFLQLARFHNMKILFRPGPYVCAEWDFGGLPARLLGVKDLVIRTSNSLYEAEVFVYFERLAPIIKPFLYKNGGNIVLIQIQNQLGSYNSDSQHTQNLIKMWKDLHIQCQFYNQDGFKYWKKHYYPGAHIGLSQGGNLNEYASIQISKIKTNNSLVFGGQVYTGWLTHWGQKQMNGRQFKQFKKQYKALISSNRSLSLFVAYGGTNFGLTAGANGFPNKDYMPHVTSYDYDATITENGRVTPKFMAVRQIMQNYYGSSHSLSPIPQPFPVISIPSISLQVTAHLFANLPPPTILNSPHLTFFQSDDLKMYKQGILLYETILPQQKTYIFNVTVHDYALVYVNQQLQQIINRTVMANYTLTVNCKTVQCKLRILVEAMGHINYGIVQGNDRKGLIKIQQKNTATQISFKWNITKVITDQSIPQWNKLKQTDSYPTLMRAPFNLQNIGDTFFDFGQLQKGYIWVNGHLLGRYWNIGPQRRIYCPAPWLHVGANQIVILDLLANKPSKIKSFESHFDP